jgi:DNA-binding transcriptional MerR regulator
MKNKTGFDHDHLLKIGDFARLAGTNLRTLRYYEELGLLCPASRSAGGFRYYRSTDVNRLGMVQRLQELGLTLEAIRELMSARERGSNGGPTIASVRHALQAQDQLLAQRQALLAGERERLANALEKLHECAACNHRPEAANNFCEPCQLDGRALPRDLSALFS